MSNDPIYDMHRAARRRLREFDEPRVSPPSEGFMTAPSRSITNERGRMERIIEIASQYDVWPLARAAMTNGMSVPEFEAAAVRRHRHRELGFRIGRLFEHAGNPAKLDGFEREQADEWNRESTDELVPPGRYHIPWAELVTRDMTAAGVSGSQFLVASDLQRAADILRPWSVAARAGITIQSGLVGNPLLPKTTGKATVSWLADENTAGTGSQPTVAQVSASPKIAIGLTTFTHQLGKQSNAEAVIRRELLRTAGTAIDQAVLNGSGAAGQPTGIINTAGIGSQSGTSLAQAGVVSMRDTIATANGNDDLIGFVGAVNVRTLLSGREVETGSGRYIWSADRLADRPARVTTDVPDDTLIAGDWSNAYLLLWGTGIILELDPYTGFKTGVTTARVLVTCDVALVHPAAFVVASSVT